MVLVINQHSSSHILFLWTQTEPSCRALCLILLFRLHYCRAFLSKVWTTVRSRVHQLWLLPSLSWLHDKWSCRWKEIVSVSGKSMADTTRPLDRHHRHRQFAAERKRDCDYCRRCNRFAKLSMTTARRATTTLTRAPRLPRRISDTWRLRVSDTRRLVPRLAWPDLTWLATKARKDKRLDANDPYTTAARGLQDTCWKHTF